MRSLSALQWSRLKCTERCYTSTRRGGGWRNRGTGGRGGRQWSPLILVTCNIFFSLSVYLGCGPHALCTSVGVFRVRFYVSMTSLLYRNRSSTDRLLSKFSRTGCCLWSDNAQQSNSSMCLLSTISPFSNQELQLLVFPIVQLDRKPCHDDRQIVARKIYQNRLPHKIREWARLGETACGSSPQKYSFTLSSK